MTEEEIKKFDELTKKYGISPNIIAQAMIDGFYYLDRHSGETKLVYPDEELVCAAGHDLVTQHIDGGSLRLDRVFFFGDYGRKWALTAEELAGAHSITYQCMCPGEWVVTVKNRSGCVMNVCFCDSEESCLEFAERLNIPKERIKCSRGS